MNLYKIREKVIDIVKATTTEKGLDVNIYKMKQNGKQKTRKDYRKEEKKNVEGALFRIRFIRWYLHVHAEKKYERKAKCML